MTVLDVWIRPEGDVVLVAIVFSFYLLWPFRPWF